MPFEIGILFGIIAALFFGTADFLSKKAVTKLGFFNALFYYQVTGWVFILFYVLLFQNPITFTFDLIIMLLLTSLCNISAFVLFFKAMEKGQISVLSPIVASWGVITVILAFTILQEAISIFQLTFMILIFLGVFLTTLEYKGFKKLKNLRQNISTSTPIAILSMILFGFGFFLLDYLIPRMGSVLPAFYIRIIGALYLLSLVPVMKIKFVPPSKPISLLLIIMGLIDVIGAVSVNTGIDLGYISIIAPIVALSSLIPVILGRIVYKERLLSNQKIGIILSILGLIGLSLV